MVESARLKYIYTHQSDFRAEIYHGLRDAVFNGETNATSKGKRIILPATFTGGPRYMIQNYQDAMAICRCAGYPDLFITFTCNPQWDEIQWYCAKHKVKPEDRPDMVCRLFKVKLDKMIKDLRYNKLFGAKKAVIYTIEFQKQGLPHAHILLFLHEQDKYLTPADINKIICAEILDPNVDNAYYEVVKTFMLHGPCGISRPTLPCMDEGRCIHHFPKKFNEVTTVDKDDDESLLDAVAKATVKESMFLAWFTANKEYAIARELTYNEFPSKFVWKSSPRGWEPRKSHQVIGRMIFVPPSSGELYYLRLLLNIIKGPISYANIQTYNGVIYSSFRDACYARGLLDDDKEYIDAIEEASHWGSGYYLRKLFATLFWSNSMVRPEAVWEKIAMLLSDRILHDHRAMFGLYDLALSDEELKNLTLIEIEQILNSNGKSLRDYLTIPFPSGDTDHFRTRN
ncbi:uncharacterized protein [Arachis hypogaea]|uniref:uncharacterized protein n=1 Tax=Arachis hypogaea TaxID=3818 RepID=UPI003B20BB62